MNKTIYAVLGGDVRFSMLAELLVRTGHTTFVAGFDQLNSEPQGVIKTDAVTASTMSDVVILPLPASKDGTTLNAPLSGRTIRFDDELIASLKNSRIYAGFTDKLIKQIPALVDFEMYDYSDKESFLISNAHATAEAVVMLAIENLPVVISDSRILITGCGRIGKFTAMMLAKLGAKVCGATRSSQSKAFMKAAGIELLDYAGLPERINEFDMVINTADAMVITENIISAMKKDAIIIDVASYPGGTDFEAAEIHSIKALHALGLPGKYSPLTAARIIYETIMDMEGEKNI